jgi:hypothetical protein
LVVTKRENEEGAIVFGYLNFLVGREHVRDLLAAGRRARLADAVTGPDGDLTLRFASASDARRLQTLAELDSAPLPSGPVLIAEVDGRLRAALPLDGGAPIADPFHRAAGIVALLRVRAAQLGGRSDARTGYALGG